MALYLGNQKVSLRSGQDPTFDYGFDSNGRLVWANPKLYLENTGISYIDTGFFADSYTTMDVIFKITDYRAKNDNTRNMLFGGSQGYRELKNFWCSFWVSSSDNNFWWLNPTDRGAGTIVSTKINTQSRYRVILNGTKINSNSYVYEEGKVILSQDNGTARDITQSASQTLFIRKDNIVDSSYYFLGKIYSAKIFSKGTLLFQFVPVPMNMQIGSFITPSNGMFDIINQKFYENKGSGTFNFGKDLL